MIYTLTVNPAVDKSTQIDRLVPTKKLRCSMPLYEAGGGGINVSKALAELGCHAKCIFLYGGRAGKHLSELISQQKLDPEAIEIKGWTRENLIVTEEKSHLQYRFGMPGPKVLTKERKRILTFLGDSLRPGDFLVASGSLPLGIPSNFYAEVAQISKKKGGFLILDSSGFPLIKAAEQGVYLLKPNLAELSILVGKKSLSASDLEAAAAEVLHKQFCEILVVSLGARGALLATLDQFTYVSAPTVHLKSAVGAGDSMVAGIVQSLFIKRSLTDMVKYAVACGTAATMTEGSKLCRKKDVNQLYKFLQRS